VGVSLRGHPTRVEHRVFGHDREGNKMAATRLALELILEEVAAAEPERVAGEG
jgi:hypothetical protein